MKLRDMRRRHAISPGFSSHDQDLGISSLKGHDSACNINLSVVTYHQHQGFAWMHDIRASPGRVSELRMCLAARLRGRNSGAPSRRGLGARYCTGICIWRYAASLNIVFSGFLTCGPLNTFQLAEILILAGGAILPAPAVSASTRALLG